MKEIDDITGEIVDAALRIHQGLGPGLLESVYESVLSKALEKRGLMNLPVGLFLNFGASTLKEGLHRIVNDLPSSASPRLRVNQK